MKPVSRRDFIKLSSLFLGSAIFSRSNSFSSAQKEKKPNIIIIVFDAMSAKHLSIYGYSRNTTPNFERFANRATVFHRNYAAANYTTSGAATLLTGMYPWKHRALNIASMVDRNLADSNLFNLLGSSYYSVGYSQNYLADIFLSQFNSSIDWKLSPSTFSASRMRVHYSSLFPRDNNLSFYAFDNYLGLVQQDVNPVPGSVFLGFLDSIVTDLNEINGIPSEDFPYGKPSSYYHFYYENNTVFQGVARTIERLNENSPFVGYFHVYSPHSPYNPHKDYVGIFDDMPLTKKPRHRLSIMKFLQREMKARRDRYDEFIADVDAAFGYLLDCLEENRILDNSYLILASDHGEVFERGEIGHGTKLLYEPVIHTPLIISSPKQKNRVDIYSQTCNTDIVPSLLNLTGSDVLPTLDGRVLPGLGGNEDLDRSIFSIVAKENSAFYPLERATIALNKYPYKLIYYMGYANYPQRFELFNLIDDPNELTDIYDIDTGTASKMKDELLTAIEAANRPFIKS